MTAGANEIFTDYVRPHLKPEMSAAADNARSALGTLLSKATAIMRTPVVLTEVQRFAKLAAVRKAAFNLAEVLDEGGVDAILENLGARPGELNDADGPAAVTERRLGRVAVGLSDLMGEATQMPRPAGKAGAPVATRKRQVLDEINVFWSSWTTLKPSYAEDSSFMGFALAVFRHTGVDAANIRRLVRAGT